MSKAAPDTSDAEFYDAGVYAIVSRLNGHVYVGYSVQLAKRIETHATRIVLGTHQLKCVAEAFKGHRLGDIEGRILERVAIKRDPRFSMFYEDKEAHKALPALREKEKEWILRVSTVNRVGRIIPVKPRVAIFEGPGTLMSPDHIRCLASA